MEMTSYVGLSRMTTLNRQLEVMSNNLANLSTPGFKGEEMQFREYLGPRNAAGHYGRVSFVQDRGVARDVTQGNLNLTSNPLDLAIQGKGYLVVDTPTGDRYTRNGRLQLNANNEVVTAQGYPLKTAAGTPLTLQPGTKEITVSDDGTVATDIGQIGKINLVAFDNEQQMIPAADGLYVTDATPQPSAARLTQGALENSNIEPITGMTRIMGIQRAYSQAKDLLDTEHERLRNMIDKLGKV